MSDASIPIDDSPAVSEELIQDQIDTCNDRVAEIIGDRLDLEDEDDIYQDIDGFLGQVEDATLDCFSDRYQTSTLFDQLKFFLRALIKERDFEDKLFREERGQQKIQDNPVDLCRWIKLYATIALDSPIEIEYIFAIEQFNLYREGYISHPSDLPTPGQETDPTLLSSILLIWYAMEEIIDIWGEILDLEESDPSKNIEDILSGTELQVGYISMLEEQRGFIRTFQEGVGGQDLRIEPNHISYFASEGDIVQFEAPDGYGSAGHHAYDPDDESIEVEKYI
ncbi:hypothetical protein [Halococcoides cellulosivorans]|uniref:Uncharacterized protein n=1 Tax=Halococcoides cellulosivorans TaxID=1679096 RepID=A0A2R4X3T1_9EURY|nr:hypothetical protein [Halococcoides cellulosivorans]AWB28456.1 hypothetical protein HARCEL1_12470 [Halococcoides cellulosivorans]